MMTITKNNLECYMKNGYTCYKLFKNFYLVRKFSKNFKKFSFYVVVKMNR